MQEANKIIILVFKFISAVCFAYVLALVSQELLSSGLFSFVFLVISYSLAFLYLVKKTGFIMFCLIDVFLIAFAFLLRFYVTIAYIS